ncbi:MAG TPA: hypothetical protein VIS31_03625 [Woeseiaceae bacterium]
MIDPRTASAPGKVVLSGEYAVLDGAAAVVMAVTRRAAVTIRPGAGDASIVRAPGFTRRPGRFVVMPDGLRWLDGAGDFPLLDAAFAAAQWDTATSLDIELDTRAFIDRETGKKIGLGSSAALMVALITALRASTSILPVALSAHRAFQHGAGSGVDIAAACTGGLLEYRMDGASVRALAWPDGLVCRVIWTGVPADTREKLARLVESRRSASRDELAAAADALATAWRTGSSNAVLAGLPDYVDALQRFDVDHDLGIFDAGHGRLAALARDAGLVYKPAGAGGGDVGVLFASDDAVLDRFVADHRLAVLACRLDPEGSRLEWL